MRQQSTKIRCLYRKASLLSCPAAIPLSDHTLTHLVGLIRARRAKRRCRWSRLDPARQALLVLAHLRDGDIYARKLRCRPLLAGQLVKAILMLQLREVG